AVINALPIITESAIETDTLNTPLPSHHTRSIGTDIDILGVGNLLTHLAVCCKPVPDDAIIGYVTQGNGISIHRQDCSNLLHMCANPQQKERLIQVSWGEKIEKQYKVNLSIDAYDRHGLIRDITQIVVSENIPIVALNCTADKNHHTAHIMLSIEVYN